MTPEGPQDETTYWMAWGDRGHFVAGELDDIAQHADALRYADQAGAISAKDVLEDTLARLYSLAAKLRGEEVPEYRYAYPMEGEN